MGQPPRIKPYLAGAFAWNREADASNGGQGVLGLYKDLIVPVSGGLGLSLEGYAGGVGGEWDGGARFFITTRLLFLGFGWDWNFRENRRNGIIAFTPYLRRGGLFGRGGSLRIEWIPTRGNSWNFGYQLPLEPHMGRTRPRQHRGGAAQGGPRPPRRRCPRPRLEALEDMRHAGRWLVENANLFTDEDDAELLRRDGELPGPGRGRSRRPSTRRTRGTPRATPSSRRAGTTTRRSTGPSPGRWGPPSGRRWPTPRGRSCSTRSSSPTTGSSASSRSRTRSGASRPGPACASRRTSTASGGSAPGQRAGALGTLDRLVDLLERGREAILEHWDGDERKVWMPLTLAVRAEDHDSQGELNALIERAVERPFTARQLRPAHHRVPLPDRAGPLHPRRRGLPRPVDPRLRGQGGRRARHDRPRGHAGVRRTLTRNVRRYDETGRMPTFMIFNTEFFYDGSGGRLFLTLLEEPLSHRLKLGKEHRDMEREMEEAQEELRQAVAGSERLQAEARTTGRRLAAGRDQGPREHHPPRRPLLPHRQAGVVPPVRPRQPDARPPQALLLRRHRGGPVPRGGLLHRDRRGTGVRGAHLGRPGDPGLGAVAPGAQDRRAAAAPLPGLRRGRDPRGAAAEAPARQLRRPRGAAGGERAKRPGPQRPQRRRASRPRRPPSPRPSSTPWPPPTP